MSRRKRKIKKRILTILIFAIVFFAGGKIGESVTEGASKLYERLTWQQPKEWNLILVNSDHVIPENYTVTLVEAEEGKYVDERIYTALNEMFVAAREDGVYPVIRDAYRSAEKQQEIMDDKIKAYKAEGYPEILAKRFAKDWVAEPGTSEHQLGMAVDINADKTLSTNQEVYDWLAENAYKYGFILRYPDDKEEITGIAYESWHYRYVGEEAAKEMYEQNLCLEEYLH